MASPIRSRFCSSPPLTSINAFDQTMRCEPSNKWPMMICGRWTGDLKPPTPTRAGPAFLPERLIKAMLLQSLYSIRSEAQLVERIDHDLLFRWFLDLRIDQEVFDATVFSHNRKRLESHGLIGDFFDRTVRRAIAAGLVSAEHFSIDGSLIEAYASIKSFKPKSSGDGNDDADNNGFKSRNAEVNFHGQKRSNDTHASTTDPDAKLMRKSDGQPGAAVSRVTRDRREPPRAGAGG